MKLSNFFKTFFFVLVIFSVFQIPLRGGEIQNSPPGIGIFTAVQSLDIQPLISLLPETGNRLDVNKYCVFNIQKIIRKDNRQAKEILKCPFNNSGSFNGISKYAINPKNNEIKFYKVVKYVLRC